MSKNILVITGSPRKNGNTNLLADAFIKGAAAKGHQVTRFNAANRTINGCRACDTCWSKGHACSFPDGFTELETLLEKADAIAFATPLYWFGMSAQIKAAIDRMYAYDMPQRKVSLKIKESILLVCAAGVDMKIFDGVIGTYRGIVDYLSWKDSGILTVPGVQNRGDVLKTDALHKAEQLGNSL